VTSDRRLWTLEEIRARLGPVLKAAGARKGIVIGSHARREADVWSDLDLVIIAETGLPFVERFRAFPRLFEAYPRAMDLLVYTPEEFTMMVESENPFIECVLKDGVVIHEG
jgi:predicted nucleotidyltransferase